MSRRPIARLPDDLVNRIAAGEVVERPANVIKELVENAIDAGATRVTVELTDGGRERIVVRDDGSGIPDAELPLAIERHCTSKLEPDTDLLTFDSLGFRGEALAAIAAVAELTLTTRCPDARSASALTLEHGQPRVRPASHPPGTTVSVARLFANLPVRRRFLKGPNVELSHAQALLRQLAFATPDVAFRLEHGGRALLSVPAAREGGDRIAALFGVRFAREAEPVVANGPVRVDGWVTPAAHAHNQRDIQVLCVNGRIVRDRHLHHAVRTAFGEALPSGLFPAYALAITLAPEAVDVNVHPTKQEVRFAALRDVHDAVLSAVSATLARIEASQGRADEANADGTVDEAGEAPSPRYRPTFRRTSAGAPARPGTPDGRLLAGRFWVRVQGDAIDLVDMHALIRDLVDPTDASGRPLLLPLPWPGPRDAEAELAACGFGLREDPERNRLLVTALPRTVPPVDPAAFLAALSVGTGSVAARLAEEAVSAWSGELSSALNARLATELAGEGSTGPRRRLDAAELARLLS